LAADSFCNSVIARDPDPGLELCRRERRDRLAVLRGGRGVMEVAEH
jgi:hypothetical protein